MAGNEGSMHARCFRLEAAKGMHSIPIACDDFRWRCRIAAELLEPLLR